MGISKKVLTEALNAADLANEIERLTPFGIGKTNFLLVDETGGTAGCRNFTIVMQSSEGWRKVWELPERFEHEHCGLASSPRFRLDGAVFTLRFPKSYVRDREPNESPQEI